jgi:integrase
MAYASVRKRTWQTKDGPKTAWIADYFDQDGARRQKTFSTKSAAKEWLPQTQQEVKERRHVPERTVPTVSTAAKAWIRRGEVGGRERSTLQQRREHVDLHIVPLLGADTKLSRINVEGFRDELLSTRSRPMAKKVMVSLKTILKQAKMAHLATDVEPIETGGRHKKRLKAGVDFPTAAEVKAGIEASEGSPKARALLCVLAFCGLRASELRALAWRHVDLTSATVTIEERADRWSTIGSPKSASSKRTIGLNETTLRALKEWKLAQPGGRILVFGTRTDHPDLAPNIQRRLLDPLLTKAGVRHYGLHAFRHFAVSTWLKSCAGDFKAVQVRAGHATLGMTLDTYGHLLDKEGEHDQLAAAERLVLG